MNRTKVFQTCLCFALGLISVGCAETASKKTNGQIARHAVRTEHVSSPTPIPPILSPWTIVADPELNQWAGVSAIETFASAAAADDTIPAAVPVGRESKVNDPERSTADAGGRISTPRRKNELKSFRNFTTASIPSTGTPKEAAAAEENKLELSGTRLPATGGGAIDGLSGNSFLDMWRRIAFEMIDASKDEYRKHKGSCGCPDDLQTDGSQCSDQSSYSRLEFQRPLCYESDVTAEMIGDYWKTKSIIFAGR